MFVGYLIGCCVVGYKINWIGHGHYSFCLLGKVVCCSFGSFDCIDGIYVMFLFAKFGKGEYFRSIFADYGWVQGQKVGTDLLPEVCCFDADWVKYLWLTGRVYCVCGDFYGFGLCCV